MRTAAALPLGRLHCYWACKGMPQAGLARHAPGVGSGDRTVLLDRTRQTAVHAVEDHAPSTLPGAIARKWSSLAPTPLPNTALARADELLGRFSALWQRKRVRRAGTAHPLLNLAPWQTGTWR